MIDFPDYPVTFYDTYSFNYVEKFKQENKRLREMLKEVEWAFDDGCCGWCYKSDAQGHAPDCKLALMINFTWRRN